MAAKSKPGPVLIRGPEDPIPAGASSIVYVGGKNENRPPEEWLPEDGLPWFGRRQCCKRKRNSGGKRCCAAPTKTGPGDCCRIHGGAEGVGRPIIHGLYSKRLLGLAARFEEIRKNDDVLDTTADVALLGTLAEAVLEQGAKFADTPTFRVDAYRLWLEAKRAGGKGDEDVFAELFGKLGVLLRTGYEIGRAMNEAAKLAQKRASVAQRERRVRTGEERAITERQFAAFVSVVTATILRESPDDLSQRLLDAIDAALVQASAPTAHVRVGSEA